MDVTQPQEWLDKAQIRDLCFAYAQACDRKDTDGLAACFADGGELVSPGFTGKGAEMPAQITSVLGQMFDRTQHKVFNTLHHIDGNEASGETYCGASHILKNRQDGKEMKLDWAIRYQDKLVRSEAGWQFIRRELIVDWADISALTPQEV